ncbi:hypothetical protein GCM10009606_17550 [Nocardioides aquiterrae]|uniref:Uncharacterized protein n=1 Tax=Nocardioides aquiterrae TaxID=203799 RepID=A0ABN1UEE2_9ACTN
MRRPSIPETRTTKALVAAICAYECAAICTGHVPTITTLNRRWPALGVVLVGALALHFWTPAPI